MATVSKNEILQDDRKNCANNFQWFAGTHCASATLRDVVAHYFTLTRAGDGGAPAEPWHHFWSESLVFGLGAGNDFIAFPNPPSTEDDGVLVNKKKQTKNQKSKDERGEDNEEENFNSKLGSLFSVFYTGRCFDLIAPFVAFTGLPFVNQLPENFSDGVVKPMRAQLILHRNPCIALADIFHLSHFGDEVYQKIHFPGHVFPVTGCTRNADRGKNSPEMKKAESISFFTAERQAPNVPIAVPIENLNRAMNPPGYVLSTHWRWGYFDQEKMLEFFDISRREEQQLKRSPSSSNFDRSLMKWGTQTKKNEEAQRNDDEGSLLRVKQIRYNVNDILEEISLMRKKVAEEKKKVMIPQQWQIEEERRGEKIIEIPLWIMEAALAAISHRAYTFSHSTLDVPELKFLGVTAGVEALQQFSRTISILSDLRLKSYLLEEATRGVQWLQHTMTMFENYGSGGGNFRFLLSKFLCEVGVFIWLVGENPPPPSSPSGIISNNKILYDIFFTGKMSVDDDENRGNQGQVKQQMKKNNKQFLSEFFFRESEKACQVGSLYQQLYHLVMQLSPLPPQTLVGRKEEEEEEEKKRWKEILAVTEKLVDVEETLFQELNQVLNVECKICNAETVKAFSSIFPMPANAMDLLGKSHL